MPSRTSALKSRPALLFSAALFASCQTEPEPMPPQPLLPVLTLAGASASIELDPNNGAFTLRRNGQVLLSFPIDALQVGTVDALDPRLSYDPYWLENGKELLDVQPPRGLAFHAATAVRAAQKTAEGLQLELALEGGLAAELKLAALPDDSFSATLTPKPVAASPAMEAMGQVAFLRLRPRVDAKEGFYGLGEWPDDVNHRGHARPMQIELDNLESANDENHVPIPLIVGTRGWGLFVENKRLGLFDVATKSPELLEITYGTADESDKGLRFYLFAAEHPLDVLPRYYALTGIPLLPAPWALGPWIWRNEHRDQAQVFDDIVKIRQLDLATSAIWLDRPYATKVNSFDFEKTRFPEPEKIYDRAHAAGLRVALWHSPYLESGTQPYLAEAEKEGYFPKKVSLLLNGWSNPIDFTNPKAVTAWKKWLGNYMALGTEGFKLDFGEDIAPSLGGARSEWQFFDGSDERTMHYGYTVAYHQVYADLIGQKGGESNGFMLCRAGRYGDQKYVSVVWPGDMDATFTRHRETFKDDRGKTVQGVGGLPATVIQGLTLSTSGYPFFGADTGGYRHSPPDKELYIRWFEQTALSAVMQVGDGSSQPPWEFTANNGRDIETLDLYRKYARLHLRLFPYEWTYAKGLSLRKGRPIVRPVGLAYPKLGAHPNDEYLFGDDLLVAPVVERGATSRKVLLPPGEWIDYWNGTVYDGGSVDGPGKTIDVAAPLSTLPLFLRRGALLPLLRPTIDTLAPTTDAMVESYANDPGALWVRVVPGASATSFTLYDGTELGQSAGMGPTTLSVKPGSLYQKGVRFEVVRTPRPSSVLVGGMPLAEAKDAASLDTQPTGWLHEAAMGGTLHVKLAAGSAATSVRINP